jgi:hypothetical protein
MIVLIEPFYHQKILILASEKSFRCATLQKSCIEKATENDFYTCGRKSFYLPSLVNFLLFTHLLELFRTYTPLPLQCYALRAAPGTTYRSYALKLRSSIPENPGYATRRDTSLKSIEKSTVTLIDFILKRDMHGYSISF